MLARNWLSIAGASVAGVGCRLALAEIPGFSGANSFPYATLFCNLLGSFLLCWFVFGPALRLPHSVRLMVAVGFLGSFTSFSAISYDLFEFVRRAAYFELVVYFILTAAGGLFAAWLGYRLAGRKRMVKTS